MKRAWTSLWLAIQSNPKKHLVVTDNIIYSTHILTCLRSPGTQNDTASAFCWGVFLRWQSLSPDPVSWWQASSPAASNLPSLASLSTTLLTQDGVSLNSWIHLSTVLPASRVSRPKPNKCFTSVMLLSNLLGQTVHFTVALSSITV